MTRLITSIAILLAVYTVAAADDAELARLRAENRMLKSTIERLREQVGELEKRLEADESNGQTTQPASTSESTSRPQDAAQWPDKLTYHGVEVSRKWVETMYDQYRHQYHVGEDGELVDLGGYYKRQGRELDPKFTSNYEIGEIFRLPLNYSYKVARRMSSGDVIIAVNRRGNIPNQQDIYPVHVTGLNRDDTTTEPLTNHEILWPRKATGEVEERNKNGRTFNVRLWRYRLAVFEGNREYFDPETRKKVELPSFHMVQHPSPAEFGTWLADGGILHKWKYGESVGRSSTAEATPVPAPQAGADALSSQSD